MKERREELKELAKDLGDIVYDIAWQLSRKAYECGVRRGRKEIKEELLEKLNLN